MKITPIFAACMLLSARALAFSETAAQNFIEAHCASCHNDVDREGGLDLTALRYEPGEAKNFTTWLKVHDRVQAGEMPPKEKKRPARTDLEAFTAMLGSSLAAHEIARDARFGRVTKRRLNRSEYETVLRDLLHAPWLQIKDQLPEDGEAHRFNKVSTALDLSHVHMARTLAAADYALQQAMSVQWSRPPTTLRRYHARDAFSFGGGDGNPDRQKFPVLGTTPQPDVLWGQAPMSVGDADPATRELEAVGWVSSNYITGFGSTWGSFRAPVSGRYRIRFSGYTLWLGPGGRRYPTLSFIGKASGEAGSKREFQPAEPHRPNFADVSPGRRHEPITVYSRNTPSRRLGGFDLTVEPGVHDLGEVWLMANDAITTDATRFFRSRPTGVPDGYVNPLAQRDGMPGVAFRWMEVEGPLYDEDTTAGYRLLFGDLPLAKVEAERPGVTIDVGPSPREEEPDGRPNLNRASGRGAASGRSGRVAAGRAGVGGGQGRGALQSVKVEVVSSQPRRDAERLLRAFMQRAYRQAVDERDVQRMLALIQQRLDAGLGFGSAMLAGYTAVLASPKFVFLAEKPGPLDDSALATRLSLFLWNSEPDDALRARAARGELQQPAVLRTETERMLRDPKSQRFVEAFLDYWLDLRKLEESTPSTTLYNDYYLDDALAEAAADETRLFFRELLDRDLPAHTVVHSDFTYVNERLAVHYGLPGIAGGAMRRVTLPSDSPRGGFMTQASVLKVTANGTTTSPVLRGKWIMERILGHELAPPPPVPAVEPDIRGAVTIRQQLDKHRSDPSCASCHQKIDPPGFALESFDVMGGWRDRYRASSPDAKPQAGFGKNGWPFAFHLALPVDPTGELADGRAFKDVRELKRLLLADEVQLARNLARQLVVFATGAPVRFSDRTKIEQILERSRASGYGVRTLVDQIVQSELFRSK